MDRRSPNGREIGACRGEKLVDGVGAAFAGPTVVLRSLRRWLVSLVVAVAPAACTAATTTDTAEPDTEALVAAHTNPVLPVDCPDPGVLRDTDESGVIYTMVCTTNGRNDVFRFYQSRDLVHWTTTNDFVFPGAHPEDDPARRHPWASDNFWAPEIHRMPDSVPAAQRYVVYYTARSRANGRLCIGTATAPTARGPYVESARAIVCHDDFGVIDATYFRDDDGTAYLYWKDDGNDRAPDIQRALGGRTRFHVQQLKPDGLTLVGADTSILDHDLAWEGDLIEAPWVIRRGDRYYLFYSAFSYCDARYAVGVASATSPMGPFVKHPSGNPILTSGGGFDGPGHGSVVASPDGRSLAFVYHAWNAGETCTQPGSARRVLVDTVRWSTLDGTAWPKINAGHPSH